MRRIGKRILGILLMCVMLLDSVPLHVMAKGVQHLPTQDVGQAVKESGMFYIGSPASSIEENSPDSYLFKVERGGATLPKTSVVLNIMDITSKYGEDYKVKIHNNKLFGEKVQGEEGSKSILEEITENNEEIVEVNDSDAVVSEESVTAEEAKNLYEKDLQDLESALNAEPEKKATEKAEEKPATKPEEKAEEKPATKPAEKAEEKPATKPAEKAEEKPATKPAEKAEEKPATKPAEKTEKKPVEQAIEKLEEKTEEVEATEDGTPLSPIAAKEFATGIKSDKQPMDGGENFAKNVDAMLSSLSIDLNSAYLKLDFEEGETEKTIEIIPIDNQKGDGDRMFQMFVVAGDKTAKISDHSGLTITIVDNEEQKEAKVSFEAETLYPEEGYIKAKVVREGAINQVVNVKVTTKQGTALAGQDFSPVDTTVTFPYGITERTLKIPIRSEFVKDTASFQIELSEPTGCTLGGISVATGVITTNDVSMFVKGQPASNASVRAQAGVDDIFYGEPLPPNCAYDLNATKDGGVWWYETPNHGNFYQLYAECVAGSATTSAKWNFKGHYDYSGFQVNWKRVVGKPSYGETEIFYQDQTTDRMKSLWISDEERWETRDTRVFIDTAELCQIKIALTRDAGIFGKSPRLNVHEIKPILRPFEVSLQGAEPLLFLNEEGNYVENTDIAALKSANQTVLQSIDDTGKAVKFSGDYITVTSHSPYSYIKGLKIVNSENGKSKVIQNNLPVGTTSASVRLTNDFIKDNLSYVTFKDNGHHGKKGQFKVQAIMGYYDSDVLIEEDYRGKVEIANKPTKIPESFKSIADGVYRIKAKFSNQYLKNTSNGADGNVVTGAATNNNQTKWILKKYEEPDRYTIQNQNGFYLDVCGGSSENLANLWTYRWNGSDAQKFQLKKESDGSYGILSKASGFKRGLDVQEYGEKEGTNVHQWDYWGQDNQRWFLEKDSKGTLFHKGDTLVLKQTVGENYKSAYTGSRIRIVTKENSNSKEVDVKRKYDSGNTCTIRSDYSSVKVYPDFNKKNNHIVVRVPKKSIDKFDTTKGIFVKALETIESKDHTDYVVVGNKDFSANTFYEMTAVAKDSTDVPVWNPIHTKNNYSQQTFYFESKDNIENNIVCLDVAKADKQKYSLSAKAYYSDTSLSGTSEGKGWIPASGTHVLVGNDVYGIANEQGKIDTIPANGIAGHYVIYKTVGSGIESFNMIKLSQNNQKDFQLPDQDGKPSNPMKVYDVPLGNITTSSINREVPYLTSVTAMDRNAIDTGSVIRINDDLTTLQAVLLNNHATYTDTDGIQRKEKVTSVDFVVYDSIKNTKKGVIKGAKQIVDKEGMSQWSIGHAFKKGEYDKYSASDKLYVQVTTDRYIGNGKSYNENNDLVENDALKQTTYAPVYTGYTFAETNRKQPVTQEINIPTNMDFIKLPLIGTMNATFNVRMISLSISELPNGGQRLSVGYIPKTEKPLADDGVDYGITDIKKAFYGIVDHGKKMKEATDPASLGMESWRIRPMFGLYLDFGLKNVQYTEHTSKKLAFMGGGVYIGVTGNFRIVQYFVIGVIPCYFGTNGELSIFTNVGVQTKNDNVNVDSVMEESNSFGDNFEPQFCLQANGMIASYVGIGLCGTIGARGGLQFDANYIYNPTIKKKYPTYRENGLILDSSIKVWLDALLFPISLPMLDVKLKFGYFHDIHNESVANAVSKLSDGTNTEIAEKPRNSEDAQWVGSNPMIVKPFSTFEQDGESYPLIENSYDRADSQLLDLGDGRTMLVFVADAGKDRTSDNRTAIQFSIYENGKWSKPVTIQKDDTADFDPNIVDAGDKVLVSWMSRNTSEKAKTNSDYLRSMEIYTTTIEKATLKVGKIERLCEDNFYDSAPTGMYDAKTGDMLVYYLKSEVTDDFGNSVSPQKNESVIVYMLYDASKGEWARDYYYPNELARPEDEEVLVRDWKGQRFLSSVLSGFGVDGQDVTDPVIVDFQAISYNGIGMYAFTVDQDNNMDTNNDREIFVQCYDFNKHKTYVPIRLTDDNISDSNPQLVRSGEHTYLFWLQNEKDIRYINVTSLIKEGVNSDGTIKESYELNRNVVFFANEEGTDINPTFGSYKAHVDQDGNLYIVWLQPVTEEDGASYQEVFASSFVKKDGQESSWSEGVRLTYSGRFNDEVAFSTDKAGNLLIVNNQYDMDLETKELGVENAQLVATKFKTVGSVITKEVEFANETPKAGEDTEVTIRVKNDGLKPAAGYKIEAYEVSNGKVSQKPVFEKESKETLTPSSSAFERFKWTMPKDYKDVKSLSLLIKVQETGMKEVSEFETESIKIKPVFELGECKIEERADGFYVSYSVTNVGNKDAKSDADSMNKVVVKYNDIYHTGKLHPAFMEAPIIDLKVGQTDQVVKKLTIPDALFQYGYTNAYIEVQNAKGEALSGAQTFELELTHPYNITVNNDPDLDVIKLGVGESLKLSATYSPSEFYTDGTVNFDAADKTVASIDAEGNLQGMKDGVTDLILSVMPYGGQKMIRVIVGKGEVTPGSKPEENPGGNPEGKPGDDGKNPSDQPSKNPDKNAAADTGDHANMLLWYTLLLAGVMVLVVYRKKNKI